jgi:hypothetical protein
MARLSDLMLTKLPVPETGAVIYPDETLTGFGVRVSRGGTRTFVLTHGRERRRISIGRVPAALDRVLEVESRAG